jgi:hypothetical protein
MQFSNKNQEEKLQKPIVHFYIAEEIRPELDGKVTAVGVFTDHKVMVTLPADELSPTLEAPIALKSVSLLFNISNFFGKNLVKIDVETNGIRRTILKPTENNLTEVGKSVNMVITMSPCIVTEFGVRNLIVTIDDNEYLFSYEVNRIDIFPSDIKLQSANKKSKLSVDKKLKQSVKK